MSMEMSHERCSELLRAYHAGDLAREEAAAVRAHVAECADCRTELAVVAKLGSGEHVELRPEERSRLHESVAEALDAPLRRTADVLPFEARPDRVPRGARWMGAAAAVLVIAVGAALAGQLFSDGRRGAGDTGAAESRADGGGAGVRAAPDFDGPAPVFAASSGELALADAGGDEPAAPESQSSRAFDDAGGGLDGPADLRRLARSRVYADFAAAYDAGDARELAEHFLSLLGGSAPERARAQLQECGQIALDESLSPILPVFAATLPYKGDASLVLGFITGDATLANYSIWVWTEGGCARPADSVYGPLP